MKRRIIACTAVTLLAGAVVSQSQTYINSWENSLEGWSVPNTNWTSVGFNTSSGVMAGTRSWEVRNTTGNFLWNSDGTQPDLVGPSSLQLTTNLANGGSVDLNVTLAGLQYDPHSFDWGIGFSLFLNQPGGAGIMPISVFNNWLGGVRSDALRFTIPASVRSAMRSNPGLPTSLRLGTGGGADGTMYLDGLRVTPYGQLDSWEYSTEGWTAPNTNFAIGGFDKTNGVTAGLYSLVVSNINGNFAWDQTGSSPDLESSSSADLTALLSHSSAVTMDVYIPAGFGGYLGFSLYLNQPGGAGLVIVSQWANWMGSFPSSATLTFTVPQAVRTALLNNSSLPCTLRLATGGGGPGTMYIDNLRATLLPPAQANLWVRELWDGIGSELIPASVAVSNNPSSAGFPNSSPWAANPAELRNCQIMAFRPGFNNDPVSGAVTMGLPATLDGSFGCMVQENNGFGFFPNTNQGSFWSSGDFLTRPLTPDGYIDFQAAGEYWFAMTIANRPPDSPGGSGGSLYSQYVTFPASGWGGLGFASGGTTNDDFVAVGASGLNVYYGPTNASYPWGQTNASKALYISQGKLGQAGNPNSTVYDPTIDPSSNPLDQPPYAPPGNERYSQTNFTGGPYHISALGAQTVGHVSGDYITLLGHLKTFGDGTATIDAKYYGAGVGGQIWNTELDTNPASITWDATYSFSFGGTLTRLLLFQNGQFPFYVFGLRAGTNFANVIGFDPGYIKVAPLANTFVGYPINMTNLAVEANTYSWASPPAGYGTLNYQWYKDGSAIGGATSRDYHIANATLGNGGTYSCVATDPSGTWGSVTGSVAVTVTDLGNPKLLSSQAAHDQHTWILTIDQPNLTGANNLASYSFSGGVVVSNVTVVDNGTTTQVELQTSRLPLGTKYTLSVSGVTNVVGKTLSTNVTVWTDLVAPGVANWDAWLYPGAQTANDYFNNFVPANPNPYILESRSLTAWAGPTSGVNILGTDGYVGDDWGGKVYGWFVPPVTTNYVFYTSCDDGGRLSLSTNDSPANLCVIACDSLWNGPNQWTNICDNNPGPGSPHRGDGTANAPGPTGYVWDNSVSGQSPATASVQNRSDQFIVAYYNSTGAPGGPPGATNSTLWSLNTWSRVEFCILPGMTNFWPNRDANGQALIHLVAGKMYYMELEQMQQGGGYNEAVTYKIAGTPDPLSPSTTTMSGAVIAGTVPFTPTISMAHGPTGPVITYTGVLLAGTSLNGITNVVAESSGATAISLGGPSQYSPAPTGTAMFYRTRE